MHRHKQTDHEPIRRDMLYNHFCQQTIKYHTSIPYAQTFQKCQFHNLQGIPGIFWQFDVFGNNMEEVMEQYR